MPRAFPNASLEDTIILAETIQEHGGGQPMRRLTLCEKLGKSPDSSATRTLITNSSKYGLTRGGYQADDIALTDKGKLATDDGNIEAKVRARVELGVMAIKPFNELYEAYKGNKLPAPEVLTDAIMSKNEIGRDQASVLAELFVVNAKYVGLLQVIAGSERLIAIDHAVEEASKGSAPASVRQARSTRPIAESPPASGTSWEKTCFYISPIGEEDSEHRKHADLFLGSLVEPAADKLGLVVVRADRISEPGMITRQIIEHVINARLVVADLSYHNPNVFYELCLRHATKKATIHLCRRADRIPFDINQFRTIVIDTSDIYSLVPQLDTYRAELGTQMRSTLEDDGGTDNPLSIFAPGYRLDQKS